MNIPTNMSRQKGLRYPLETIAYAVRTYHRLALNTADAKALLAARGMIVSRNAVRLWANRFGPHFANRFRRDRPRPNDKWRMDEAVITIRVKKHRLWRAIDASRDVLDILVQTRRNAKATKRCFERLVSRFGDPRVVITDKSRNDIKPVKIRVPGADHRTREGLNNAINVSHQPTRKREKIFGKFKPHRQTHRFLSAHDQVNLIFSPRRNQLTATSYRHARNDTFCLWANHTAKMAA